jgi:hypothetical protein
MPSLRSLTMLVSIIGVQVSLSIGLNVPESMIGFSSFRYALSQASLIQWSCILSTTLRIPGEGSKMEACPPGMSMVVVASAAQVRIRSTS